MTKTRREWFQIWGPAVVLTLAGFIVAYQFVQPAPPSEIIMATGAPEGAYYRYASRYKEILEQSGITLNLRNTRGSSENLRLLKDPSSNVDIALTQSGTATTGGAPGKESAKDAPELMSLAGLYHEPLWIFVRGTPPPYLRELNGKRIAVGEDGSGTKAVAERLLAANGLTPPASTWLSVGGQKAARGLRDGEIDVAFFVYGIDTPLVQQLLRASGIQLMSLRRAAAYTRRNRYLAGVTLPEGVVDLEKNIPPHDVRLLAPVASLTTRSDFHPALIELLLGAAQEVHGEPGILEEATHFPSAEHTDFPVGAEAKRFLARGPSFFNRFLPFWAANFLDRMMVMLVPLLTLLIPLIKIVPPLHRWRVRSRFKRWYRDLQAIDASLGEEGVDYDARLAQLHHIRAELTKITVPPIYGDELYHLRFHISLVEEKIKGRQDRQRSRLAENVSDA